MQTEFYFQSPEQEPESADSETCRSGQVFTPRSDAPNFAVCFPGFPRTIRSVRWPRRSYRTGSSTLGGVKNPRPGPGILETGCISQCRPWDSGKIRRRRIMIASAELISLRKKKIAQASGRTDLDGTQEKSAQYSVRSTMKPSLRLGTTICARVSVSGTLAVSPGMGEPKSMSLGFDVTMHN
ncbi:hypothetical protein VTO42DRAFT_8081 [Malbranchea cinnamomea]